MSPDQIHGRRLEFQQFKSVSPTLTPQRLAPLFPCLPPILYINYRNPISSYSKAPWGLSVLSQVTSIFTSTTISPSTLSRQLPNHYAFRAGQNLPDKEFRYLRTVIVTAAVHWGFSSMLPAEAFTSYLNLPALGRRQLLYFHFRVCRNLCFW